MGDVPVGLVNESGQWRVLVTFKSQSQAETALRRLRELGEVGAAGASISLFGDDPSLLVYVPNAEAVEPVAAAVRHGLDEIGTKPVRVSVDRWLPAERRWDGDKPRKPGSDLFDLDDAARVLFDVISGFRF